MAIFRAWTPNGMVMINRNISSAASAQPIAIQSPESTNQRTLRISRTG